MRDFEPQPINPEFVRQATEAVRNPRNFTLTELGILRQGDAVDIFAPKPTAKDKREANSPTSRLGRLQSFVESPYGKLTLASFGATVALVGAYHLIDDDDSHVASADEGTPTPELEGTPTKTIQTHTPEPTQTQVPTLEPTATKTIQTHTPEPTRTPGITPTLEVTPTETKGTHTPEATSTSTLEPTSTKTPEPTSTPKTKTPTATATSSPIPSPTVSPTPAALKFPTAGSGGLLGLSNKDGARIGIATALLAGASVGIGGFLSGFGIGRKRPENQAAKVSDKNYWKQW